MLELVSFIMWQAISVQMVKMMIVGMMKEVAEAHITHWTCRRFMMKISVSRLSISIYFNLE